MFYNTGYNRWQGVVAMGVGLVVSVYFFANVFGLYVGPVPNANPAFGDITFIVGFLLSGALYYVFNLNLRKDTAANRAAMGSRAASRFKTGAAALRRGGGTILRHERH